MTGTITSMDDKLPLKDKGNDPILWRVAHPDLKAVIQEWVALKIRPTGDFNRRITSYSIKSQFQIDTGLYCLGGVMIGAMLEAGYNWDYQGTNPNPNCQVLKFPRGTHYREVTPTYAALTSEGTWKPEWYPN